MSTEIAVGVIGAGQRSADTVRFTCPDLDVKVRVEAIADVDPARAEKFRTRYGRRETAIYAGYRQMLDSHKFDAVVVGTPNSEHADQAVAVMERRIPMLLEKPIATAYDDCRRILDAHRSTKTPVTVGFVLRYTPFYQRIKEVIESGAIGEVMAINAEELMSRGLTSGYFRGWRRSYEKSGGLLLEKCCHDIDILNWLMDGMPEQVSSFGSQVRVFAPKAGAAGRCRDCSIRKGCDYDYWYFHEKYGPEDERGERSAEGEHIKYALTADDSCIYGNPDFTLGLEAQSVSMVYPGGVPVHFSLVMAQEWSHRGIHILGSKGRIYGDPDDNRFSIFTGCHDHETDRERVIELTPNSSGHYGGDSVIAGEFIRSAVDPSYSPKASVEEGYKSVLVCLAAEKARMEGRVVRLQEFE